MGVKEAEIRSASPFIWGKGGNSCFFKTLNTKDSCTPYCYDSDDDDDDDNDDKDDNDYYSCNSVNFQVRTSRLCMEVDLEKNTQ